MQLVRRTSETAEGGTGAWRRRVLLCACAGWLAGAAALDGCLPKAHAFGFDRERLETTMRERFGAPGVQRLREWLALLQAQAARPLKARLAAVNEFWNRVVLSSEDISVWGQSDYWATPLESLGKRAGDCEDYVIGKYFSLLYLGMPGEQLRFIYVRARIGGVGSAQSIAHMVLGYYETPQGEPLVLDNMINDILPARDRPDLTPVFSFNAGGIYLPGRQPTPAERISRWPDLLARMQQEGFMP
ncbi:MAG: transglutaminase-like cysteine peptidase [Comamonas sp.]|jgi:predicted transglutaminase-like cysteine proteinase